jgi:hypothetical protein
METAETIRAAMFVDATYEGDLFAAANITYRVGREPVGAYGESLAGQWQNVSWKNTYQFCRLPLSPYVEPGDPQTGLLPEISSEPPGKTGEGDFKVQAYNFRMYLTDKAGRIPFPEPRGYEPGRYALLARFLNADPRIRWTLNYTTVPMTDGPVQMRIGDNSLRRALPKRGSERPRRRRYGRHKIALADFEAQFRSPPHHVGIRGFWWKLLSDVTLTEQERKRALMSVARQRFEGTPSDRRPRMRVDLVP